LKDLLAMTVGRVLVDGFEEAISSVRVEAKIMERAYIAKNRIETFSCMLLCCSEKDWLEFSSRFLLRTMAFVSGGSG